MNQLAETNLLTRRLSSLSHIGILLCCSLLNEAGAQGEPDFKSTLPAETTLPEREPEYKLVWSDEFNTDGPPDETNWRFEKGFTRNHEWQWYQKENAFCKDGKLVIEARREKVTNPNYREGARRWQESRKEANYTSASLTTSGKHQWTYCRMEIRARFPALEGLWPALWTTGVTGRWPHGGEIDIMEYYKHGILANFCWAGPRGKDKWDSTFYSLNQFDEKNWNDTFHEWVLIWTEERIAIYLDGKLLNDIDMKTPINEDGPAINPFNSPQAFRVNMALGGTQGGNPDKTPFPQRYEIDYVRVYQKKKE